MSNLTNLSENELQQMISDAELALKQKQSDKRKEVLAEINRLAASIDVKVEIVGGRAKNSRKGGKVAPKYRNPDDASQQWTGRGVMPRWMKALVDAGQEREDFLI
jgi:DNA-binding protein H-NS